MRSVLQPVVGIELKVKTDNPFLQREYIVLDGFCGLDGCYLILRSPKTEEWPLFDATVRVDPRRETMAFIDIEKGPYMDEKFLEVFKELPPHRDFQIHGKGTLYTKLSIDNIRAWVIGKVFKV